MRKTKQETREEKINRHIRNISRLLERDPSLDCLREIRAEHEAQLQKMPLEERRALVPWEETERERKEHIAILTEMITDLEKELEAKRQEIKRRIAGLRRGRAKLQRRGPYC
jgi:hypothetical protein